MSSYIINSFSVAPSGITEMIWNAADKSSGIILFDDGREAYHESGTGEAVRGDIGMSTGKWCWAMHTDSVTGTAFRTGIATASFDLAADSLGGGTANTIISNAGVVLHNSGTLADYTDYARGDYIMVAFDADAGDLWFGRNGTWEGDPAAGTGAVKSDVAANTWYPVFGSTGTGPVGKVTLVPFVSCGAAAPLGFEVLQPPHDTIGKHWESVQFQGLPTNSAAWNGNNLRMHFTAAQLLNKTGTKIRFRMQGGTTENAQVSDAAWGTGAGSGDAYDFAATPTALTVGATTAFTVTAGTATESDEFNYSYDGGSPLNVAFHFNNSAHDNIGGANSVTGYTAYFKAAANEVNTVDVTAYSNSANAIRFVQEVQVLVDD